MSKRVCKDKDLLSAKMKGKKKKYLCSKCHLKSTKEKWVCKPVPAKP